MRLLLLTLLAAAGLLVSAGYAPRYQGNRPNELPDATFTTPPRERIESALAERRLGAVLSGYEDLLTEDPGDVEALRARIRHGLMIGAVSLGQPGLGTLVQHQTDTYLGERRHEIDPDGTFLPGVIEEWAQHRMKFTWDFRAGFYARSSMCMYAAARGHPDGAAGLLELAKKGEFHLEIFPFIRQFHPAWPAVRTLLAYYLEHGDLVARVESAATLLDYHLMFGEGKDLLDRQLPVIRAAIKEMRDRMRAGKVGEGGRATVIAMGLLALQGDEREREILERAAKEKPLYVPFVDTITIARVMAGLEELATYAPHKTRFKALDLQDQDLYYFAAAHRAAHLKRTGGSEDAYRQSLRMVQTGFDAGSLPVRVFCIQAIGRLEPAMSRTMLQRAIDDRGLLSLYAMVLSRDIDDVVPMMLPALRATSPDVASLAAATMLDLGDSCALQR